MRNRSKRKIFSRKLLLLILVVPLLVVVLAMWWQSNVGAVSDNNSEKVFIIPKGKSAIQVGRKLYEEGLIRSPLAFKVYVQVTSQSEDIQAGEYRLSSDLPLTEVVTKLIRGPVGVWIVVPEGLRREEIAERFVEGFELSGEEADVFREELLESSDTAEGYLFPDTYLFQKGTSAEKVVTAMLTNFDKRTSELIDSNYSGYTLEDVVTVAAMLERETITFDEKPIVAGILYKRLEADWPLQIDAAVQYGVVNSKMTGGKSLDNYWPILTRADIDNNSPYNTYKFTGLPPGPISNPGLASLEAAAAPEESDYWFYVHDSSGVIHYGETLSDHNENVRVYLGK